MFDLTKITILSADDMGQDVLRITATIDGFFTPVTVMEPTPQPVLNRIGEPILDANGNPVTQMVDTPVKKLAPTVFTAQGWISAITNYYSPDKYDQYGNQTKGSTAREMVQDEKVAYCKQLIVEQNPQVNTPISLGIV